MKRARTSVLALMAVVALALASVGCDETVAAPTPLPNQVEVNVTVTQTIGTPLPNGPGASPTPIPPGAVDKTIVSMTVTEIGGDGQRTFEIGETHALTATPRNRDGVDPCIGFPTLTACGAYTEQDIRWFAGTGVVTDCTSTTGIVCDLGPSDTNYNRRFRALRAGSFTYSAQFRDQSPVSFTGTVQ